MMLREWQSILREWYEHQWGGGRTVDNMIERVAMKLAEEAGEVNGAIVKSTEPKHPQCAEQDLAAELGDVVICAMVLADFAEIDLEDATRMKIDKLPNLLREWVNWESPTQPSSG